MTSDVDDRIGAFGGMRQHIDRSITEGLADVIDVRNHQYVPERPGFAGRAGFTESSGRTDESLLSAMRDELLDNLKVMKRARFNAAKRMRHKNEAGQFVLALAFVYGSLIPLFTLQFREQVGDLNANLLSFVAAVASMLSFVVGVHYQQKNLGAQAQRFHDCGLALNKLRYQLKTDADPDRAQMLAYLDRYDEILASCENHDDVDYDRARYDGQPQPKPWVMGLKISLQRIWQTYAVSLSVIMVPPAVGAAIWVLFSAQ